MAKKKVYQIALVFIGFMVLFPPYEILGAVSTEVILGNGYAFMLTLPSTFEGRCCFESRVDIGRLFLQVLIVGIASFVAERAFKNENKEF